MSPRVNHSRREDRTNRAPHARVNEINMNRICMRCNFNHPSWDKHQVKYIRECAPILSNFIYQTNMGEFCVSFDWAAFISQSVNKDRKAEINIDCEITGNFKKDSQGNFARHLLEVTLYDYFLALNLGYPGIIDFWNAEVPAPEFSSSTSFDKLRLSYIIFVQFNYYYKVFYGDKTDSIPPNQIWSWFRRVFPTTIQVANTPVQRSLYSLLHICANDNISPASCIWICQAIESIFATNDGKLLRKRVLDLVDAPEKNRNKLYAELQEVFKKRHSFVHGGHPIPHPLRNEVIDRSVDDLYSVSLDTTLLGAFILIQALRQLTLRNWITLEFNELLRGT